MSILKVENLDKNFSIDKTREVKVLKNISLDIKKGEFIAIVGSSGAGKSTLLSILAGLENPTNGKIILDGNRIDNLSENELSDIRKKKIGFIFQSFYLIPSLTAIENIAFPLELNKVSNPFGEALKLLKLVNLEHRKDNYPNSLSGGEQQRVAICRSLIHKPSIIFADEPTGNLDSKNGDEILDILLKLKKFFSTTLIVVTHEDKVSNLADRVIEIKDGKIVESK